MRKCEESKQAGLGTLAGSFGSIWTRHPLKAAAAPGAHSLTSSLCPMPRGRHSFLKAHTISSQGTYLGTQWEGDFS